MRRWNDVGARRRRADCEIVLGRPDQKRISPRSLAKSNQQRNGYIAIAQVTGKPNHYRISMNMNMRYDKKMEKIEKSMR